VAAAVSETRAAAIARASEACGPGRRVRDKELSLAITCSRSDDSSLPHIISISTSISFSIVIVIIINGGRSSSNSTPLLSYIVLVRRTSGNNDGGIFAAHTGVRSGSAPRQQTFNWKKQSLSCALSSPPI
jgi:hypothetical protein